MKSFKQMADEEVAANSVAGGGVDFNPTGMPKRDKRKKDDVDRMYRRSVGIESIKKILAKRDK